MRKFTIASSSSVYGVNAKVPFAEDDEELDTPARRWGVATDHEAVRAAAGCDPEARHLGLAEQRHAEQRREHSACDDADLRRRFAREARGRRRDSWFSRSPRRSARQPRK